MIDITDIEKRVDRTIAGPIAVNVELGGLTLENMAQVMEFAKLMAISGAAVPKYLRGNPGACLAICSRALRWGMDPFAVAEKSYMVVNRGEERIAFEAQLIHAIVTSRAPLRSRLRYEIIGDGDDRRCTVWGTFKGEDEPHKYTSEPLGKLREARGRNEFGVVKGSPLWEAVPEVQLAYSSVRQWARLFASETLLGVYTPDELQDGEPIDVTPPGNSLAQRLKNAKAAHASQGFDAAKVAAEVATRVIEQEVGDEATEGRDSQTGTDRGTDDVDSAGGSAHEAGSAAAGGSDQLAGGTPAEQTAAPAQGEGSKAKPKQKKDRTA
jgi:hypothetical protein